MVDQIAMALDDIIKANKIVFPKRGETSGQKFNATRKAGGGRGGSGVGGGFKYGPTGGVIRGRNRGGITKSANYTRGNVDSAWKHDMYNDFDERKIQTNAVPVISFGPPGITTGPTKLLVSNLDFGVSDSDIQELFSEFGSLKSAAIHYDRSGRSLGTADIVFERRADAWKAMKQYNGVPLDGKAMSIQLATSEIAEIAFRTGERRGIGSGNNGGGGGGPVRRNIKRGGGGSRYVARSGGGHGAGGAGRGKRPLLTAEQLDAELDAYVKEIK